VKQRSVVRRGVTTVLFIGGLVALIKGCPLVFPKGFPTGNAGPYSGIVSLPREGWDYALFTSSDLLNENERLRGHG
jgi:hypothetical protein